MVPETGAWGCSWLRLFGVLGAWGSRYINMGLGVLQFWGLGSEGVLHPLPGARGSESLPAPRHHTALARVTLRAALECSSSIAARSGMWLFPSEGLRRKGKRCRWPMSVRSSWTPCLVGSCMGSRRWVDWQTSVRRVPARCAGLRVPRFSNSPPRFSSAWNKQKGKV